MTPPRSRAANVHEYRCVACGLRLRGNVLAGGRIVPTNSLAPTDAVLDCMCLACAERAASEGQAVHDLVVEPAPRNRQAQPLTHPQGDRRTWRAEYHRLERQWYLWNGQEALPGDDGEPRLFLTAQDAYNYLAAFRRGVAELMRELDEG